MSKKKVLSIFTVMVAVIIGFAGCGSNNSDKNNKSDEKINIKDIDWAVDEGIVDGKRFVLFNYTNNTPYTITELKMTFKEKASITEDDKSKFYSYFEDVARKSGQTEKEVQEGLQEIKKLPISIKVDTQKLLEQGESAKSIKCNYFDGYVYVRDIAHYNLLEPDIATIKYIDNDKIFTMYYDFGSKKYTTEEETKLAYEWHDTPLSSKVVKPNAQLVENSLNSDRYYSFYVYGYSVEEFNSYIEECKKLGFTIEPYNSNIMYSAENAEGYDIDITHDEDKNSMYVSIDAPSK